MVLAEIRVPENKNRDTHNLGKTTLGRLLDFGFLSGRSKSFFLFKHLELFEDFVFFFEIELDIGRYVTLRRSVENPSKIAFKRHSARHQDFSSLEEKGWDHYDVPFDRAKKILDSMLDLDALKPWHYRKGLGYFLRSQDDFQDVFHLRRFANSHADWKPFLAHILGFNATLVGRHYEKEDEIDSKQNKLSTLRMELGDDVPDGSQVDGILLLKRQEADKKQMLVDQFDFRHEDKAETQKVVEQVDGEIASLNERRYSLQKNRQKLVDSLDEDQILFSPENAKDLFAEAGVVFEGQIKKDFQQLISFNQAITDERRGYLLEEQKEIDAELESINAKLDELGGRRSELLSFLSSTDAFDKYKRVSGEIVSLRADIESLERQREIIKRFQILKTEIRSLKEEKTKLQNEIEADVETQSRNDSSQFSMIRIYFNEIVEEVIDKKALLNVEVNNKGHLEFNAGLLDDSGNTTSADRGHSYKKLLCVAFDLAVLRAHLGVAFPRFAYHDGVFESLDDRKKSNLLAVFRRYCTFGIQSTITLIDSDMPPGHGGQSAIDSSEIILLLHDENETGRLFKMEGW